MVERIPWITQFNIEYFLGLDGLNLFFFLIITFITPLALLGSWNVAKRNWQFQIQMLLLQIGMLGCFAAMDVVLFYVFFEVMLVPMYLLIGICHHQVFHLHNAGFAFDADFFALYSKHLSGFERSMVLQCS